MMMLGAEESVGLGFGVDGSVEGKRLGVRENVLLGV